MDPADAQQLAFRGIDLRLHGLPLGGEAPGDVDDLTALLQRLLLPPARMHFLQQASLAMVTDAGRGCNLQSACRI